MDQTYAKALESYEYLFGPADLDDFDSRMKFQKTTYLLKILGVDFSGLKFTWFRRGPYCFELVGVKYKPKPTHPVISREEIQKIDQHKSLIHELMDDPKDAELYSSIAFLQREEKLSPEQITRRMSLVKPWFTQKEVEEGMERVGKIGA